MNKVKYIALFFLLTFFSNNAQTSWDFDPSHTEIGFSVTHLVIAEVSGKFNSFDGKVTTKDNDFDGGSVEFSVNVGSINTENEDRDKHLKSDDFFNAEKFPKMIFKSKSLKKVSGKKYKLIGDLTIRDITKEVELNLKHNGTIKDPWGNTKAGFKITGELNRFDFGLKWSKVLETGGLVVGDMVELNINAEIKKI